MKQDLLFTKAGASMTSRCVKSHIAAVHPVAVVELLYRVADTRSGKIGVEVDLGNE